MQVFNLMEECLKYGNTSKDNFSEQNKDLIRRAQNGDQDALSQIMMINGRLVVSVMKRYAPQCLHGDYQDHADDLFQQGMLSLQRAVEMYDFDADTEFSTYAYHWIRQAISRYMLKNQMIHVPVNVVEKSITVQRFILQYQISHDGKLPNDDVICKETNISRRMLQQINYFDMCDVQSLDAVCYHSDDGADILLMEVIPDEKYTPDTEILQHDLNNTLMELLSVEANGNSRNIDIMARYFGLNGDAPMTLQEISDIYHISRERVRQIIERILTGLQKPKNKILLEAYVCV